MTRTRWMAWVGLLMCAGGARLAAQAAPGKPEITGLAHVAFRVSDVDREVNFFGKLGFEEAFSNTENGKVLQVFIKVNDRQFIEVYAQENPPKALGFLHACYEAPDLNGLHDKYVAAGLKVSPVRKAGAGNLLVTMQDPEGRVVEFTQYMPGSRHMQDKGQHLGERRISDEMLGFELPVGNLDAEAKTYSALGFDAEQEGLNYRLTIPANPDLRIELHATRAGDRPQFLFPVDDAKKTASELHSAGLNVVRDKKLVFVRDPDGNSFVLLETGEHSPRHLMPFHKH